MEEQKAPDTPIEPKSDVETVREQREKLKAENDAFEAELLRAEQLKAQRAVAGKADVAPPQPVIESAKDYAKRVMRGEI